jgi:DNA-binding NarL/FixJ family response regulator
MELPAQPFRPFALGAARRGKILPNPSVPVVKDFSAEPPDDIRITSKVRVLIADDHVFILQGLRRVLEKHPMVDICGEARNGREAVEKTAQLQPHIVILDLSMPELNGLDATAAIHSKNPRVEVLILTMHFSEQVARQVLRAGARGYMLKGDAENHLLAAIASLQRHKPYLTPRVADLVLTGFVEGETSAANKRAVSGEPRFAPLSRREREVLQLLAQGLSNKEVAQRLNVSPRTIETHRNHLMNKLRLERYSDLIKYAVRNNIVEP